MLNLIKNNSDKKIIKKSLIGLLVSLLIFPLLSIIGFTGIGGRIIGFIFYFIITIFCIFEFSSILPIPKWSKYYLSLSVFLFFFFSFSSIEEWILNKDSSLEISHFIREQYVFKIKIEGLGYLILFLILILPFLFSKWDLKKIISFIFLFIACILIGITGKNLFYLNSGNFWFMVVLFTSVIATDTFAYFGGRFFGGKFFSRKLAPKLSPNKTIEGAIIGYIAGFIIIFTSLYIKLPFNETLPISNSYIRWIAIPVTLPLTSICGDLLFSGVKRYVNIKDFSSILPEHGGLLDRLDAIIVVSFFYLMIFI